MRWKNRPEGSTWGDWGPDDQRGRMNLLTPERIKRAAREVKEGRVFCLSLPLDVPGGNVLNPRRHPPALRPTYRDGKANMNFPLRRLDPHATDVISDDAALIHLQYSTQWDSFAHVGSHFDADGDGVAERVYYNGFRADEDVVGPTLYRGETDEVPREGWTGARRLGIENMAETGAQGRGVMIDLLAHFGPGRTLVGWDQLRRVLDADRIEVEPGDFVHFRTGFSDALLEMAPDPDGARLAETGAVIDGRDKRLLDWITDTGLVALIADNYAVEAQPARPCEADMCASLPLHEHCLFKLGVHLGELFLLSPLADWLRANRRRHFLFTGPPLRLPGAVGSPATPVATV
jgi:kynurenine formamidase